jgi:large subunit ribosomal protein L7/L12
MEEEFGVSAAAPVMVAAAGAWDDENVKSTFNVVLTSAGASKIAVIKVIREITGLGLKEAKDLADNGGNVKENAAKDEADEIKAKLEEAGASIELK